MGNVRFQSFSFIPTVDGNVFFHGLDTNGQLWNYNGKTEQGRDKWLPMDMPEKASDADA